MSKFETAGALILTTGLFLSACDAGSKVSADTEPSDVETTRLALAEPITSIAIDGDVSDWPDDRPTYAIAALLENEITSPQDLSAGFQVGYSSDRQAVLFAVTVQDDIHSTDDTSEGLTDSQDQLLVYYDKAHAAEGSGVQVLSFNEHHREMDDVNTSWDPAVRDGDGSDITVAASRSGNQTVYEGEILLDEPVQEGMAIGLDFMLYDSDGNEDETTRVSWRDSDGKTNVPFRLGHVFLVNDASETGRVEGRLAWAGESLGGPINTVRIASLEHGDMWVRDEVDESGEYSIALPVGAYSITPEWGIYNGGDVQHKVAPKEITTNVLPDETVLAPVLNVEVAPSPGLIPEEGVLISMAKDRHDQIDAFVSAYMTHFDIPGVSLAIIEDGALSYHQTYGVSNTYSDKPVTPETIFEAASITKPVFAFAVMRLAERGLIDLDKPLHKYLPFEDIAHDERYKLITARHVLSHKTGFPNWRSGKMTINFDPGTQFGYSGEGFQYLQRVVEHVMEKDIVQILDEEVLTPLQLDDVYFEKSDRLFEIVAHGHDDNYPHKVSLPNKAGMAWSMHTEAEAFSDFATALLEGRGLSPESYEDMLFRHTVTDKYEDTDRPGWSSFFGLGFQIEDTPFGMTFGHGGNNGDFKCEFKLYPELGVGFIIFTNGNTGNQLTDSALEQFLITGKLR